MKRNGGGRPLATVLTYVLAGGFYVGLWGGCLGLTVGAVWFATQPSRTFVGVPSWGFAGWCAFSALFLVVAQLVSGSARSVGRPLPREQAPELHALLDRTRQELGVPPVREIRLKPAPVLGVTRLWRRRRLFVREYKALVLGLPLLRAFTVEELRAALAHELAHFAGGDVKRRRVVNGALRRIALMCGVLERGNVLLTWANPLWWALRLYGWFLRGAAGAIRRAQECRADRTAAAVAGQQTYGRTLLKGAVLGIAFRRLALGIVVRARRTGEPEENFFRAFDVAMRDLAPDHRERMIREALREERHPGDEHPPLIERLAALDCDPSDALEVPGPSATELVPGLESIERALTPLAMRGLALGLRKRLRRRLSVGAARADGAGWQRVEELPRRR